MRLYDIGGIVFVANTSCVQDCRIPFNHLDGNGRMRSVTLDTFIAHSWKYHKFERSIQCLKGEPGHKPIHISTVDPPDDNLEMPTHCWNFLDIPITTGEAHLTKSVLFFAKITNERSPYPFLLPTDHLMTSRNILIVNFRLMEVNHGIQCCHPVCWEKTG